MYVWASGREHIGSVSLSVFVHLLHVSVSLTIVCFLGGDMWMLMCVLVVNMVYFPLHIGFPWLLVKKMSAKFVVRY